MRARLAALAFSLGLLLLVELGARVLGGSGGPEHRGIVLEPHPTRIWALSAPAAEAGRPPLYRLTPEGNRAPAEKGPGDAPLILTTGDSSIFGDGIADGATLHDQLSLALAARGVPARVETVAVPGYSTLQTRAALDEDGWALGPALLLIGNLWSDSNLDYFRDAALQQAAGAPLARLERGLAHLATFKLLRTGVNRGLGRPSARRITWPQPGQKGVRRVPLVDYARNLEAVLDEARDRGIGAVILALCNKPMLRQGLRPDQAWYPYFQVQRAVAEARGVRLVEALPAFQQSGRPPDQLFNDELHPSREGDAILGRAVADALREAGWPGESLLPGQGEPVTVPPDPFDGQGVADGHSAQMDILEDR